MIVKFLILWYSEESSLFCNLGSFPETLHCVLIFLLSMVMGTITFRDCLRLIICSNESNATAIHTCTSTLLVSPWGPIFQERGSEYMCWPWASHHSFIPPSFSSIPPSHPFLPILSIDVPLVNVREYLSSLSSERPTIKMMSELGVLKPYPFTHLGDDWRQCSFVCTAYTGKKHSMQGDRHHERLCSSFSSLSKFVQKKPRNSTYYISQIVSF